MFSHLIWKLPLTLVQRELITCFGGMDHTQSRGSPSGWLSRHLSRDKFWVWLAMDLSQELWFSFFEVTEHNDRRVLGLLPRGPHSVLLSHDWGGGVFSTGFHEMLCTQPLPVYLHFSHSCLWNLEELLLFVPMEPWRVIRLFYAFTVVPRTPASIVILIRK